MKLLTQYLNHALTFEGLAATEPSLKLKAALAEQARAYRKLAAERAAKLGLPQPSEPVISNRSFLVIERQNKAATMGKRPWTVEDDRRLLELRAAGRSTISFAAALKRTRSAITHRLQNLRGCSDNLATQPAVQNENADPF